jgi:hypothetical protein
LRLHLTRFPSVQNGLNRIEDKSLEMISSGAHGFKSLFPQISNKYPVYGMGDSQFWCMLKRLGTGLNPLITVREIGGAPVEFKSNPFLDASFDLTDTGRAVLAGERDFIDLNGIDLWLGGVQIVDQNVWRWDDQQQRLKSPQA